jgi:hypothetical protein
MALLRGSIFITDDPFDAALLEEAITHALAYRSDHGKHNHPERLYVLQSELHMLAATEAATAPRHAAQLVATPTPPKSGSSGTMSVVEASQELDLSPQMVRRHCESGVLDAVKVADLKVAEKWKIRRASVAALKARRRSA